MNLKPEEAGIVVHTINPNFQEHKAGDGKCQPILGYLENYRKVGSDLKQTNWQWQVKNITQCEFTELNLSTKNKKGHSGGERERQRN